jgi:hypothetical protein
MLFGDQHVARRSGAAGAAASSRMPPAAPLATGALSAAHQPSLPTTGAGPAAVEHQAAVPAQPAAQEAQQEEQQRQGEERWGSLSPAASDHLPGSVPSPPPQQQQQQGSPSPPRTKAESLPGTPSRAASEEQAAAGPSGAGWATPQPGLSPGPLQEAAMGRLSSQDEVGPLQGGMLAAGSHAEAVAVPGGAAAAPGGQHEQQQRGRHGRHGSLGGLSAPKWMQQLADKAEKGMRKLAK